MIAVFVLHIKVSYIAFAHHIKKKSQYVRGFFFAR